MRPRVEELTTLECGHTYHAYCIGEWHRVGRRADNECPLGRCHLRIREPEPPLKLGLIISALLLLVFGFESTATTATTATTTTTTPAADNYWNKHWKQLTITNIIFSNYIHTTVDICGALVAQDWWCCWWWSCCATCRCCSRWSCTWGTWCTDGGEQCILSHWGLMWQLYVSCWILILMLHLFIDFGCCLWFGFMSHCHCWLMSQGTFWSVAPSMSSHSAKHWLMSFVFHSIQVKSSVSIAWYLLVFQFCGSGPQWLVALAKRVAWCRPIHHWWHLLDTTTSIVWRCLIASGLADS